MPFLKYGLEWPDNYDPLQLEFYMIQNGGRWSEDGGATFFGVSLFHHHREAQNLLWPEDDNHRWSDLILKTMCEQEITVLMGCADSGKTYGMSKFVLVDYWCHPDKTFWLVSSTEFRGAEIRVWGWIKQLFNRAKDLHPNLAGTVVEYLHTITTETIDKDGERARSLQKGIMVVPCKKGGQNVGISAYVGVKSPRLRHAGDEVSLMGEGFLDAYSNWYGKENFKGIMAGNPLDPSDPLCKAGEPIEGWDNFYDTEKTQTWRSKFYDAVVVALDGRDSPNFDFPQDKKARYHYLIGKKKLDAVAKTEGKDSWKWFSQCVGKPNKQMVANRVITRRLCEQHLALEDCIWQGRDLTAIYAIDPAYGGEDRCVGGRVEFGLDISGHQLLKIYPPEIIPVSMKANAGEPEDQITQHTFHRLRQLGIPAENSFYDSFGRGTLGFAFAKVFGANCPIPVDAGARPTVRPVRFDLFIEEEDGTKRLKRCNEHYSKFITEMWFSVREVIISEQMRELPKDVMDEGCLRIYKIVAGNKTEVEPKEDMMERINRSPDLFDWLAVAVEGARQRGFKIRRLGQEIEVERGGTAWFKRLHDESMASRKKSALIFTR